MANFYGRYPASNGGGGGGGSGTGFTATGTTTLTNGTATVSDSGIGSGSIIFLTCLSVSGIQGILSVGTVTAGVSFVVNSTSAEDGSTISWGYV